MAMMAEVDVALPMVKPEHVPYRIAGGRVRIGGVVFGIAAEVSDPTGALWSALQAMDGTRTVGDVVGVVRRAHPDCPPGAVRAWIEQLTARGYVEDAATAEPADMTGRERVRHDRARRFFRWIDLTGSADAWRAQRALRDARVCIVGVGGTGGHAALALAASGVGRLHLVDGDVVELSNLGRQVIYTEADIGRSKVDSAADRLAALNSDITITTDRHTVASADDMAVLAAGCDVLLLAADSPRDTRAWANLGCLAAGTAWVDAGYHGPLVQVGIYRPHQSACWVCVREVERERHAAVGARPDDVVTARRATANAVGAVSAGVSGQLAAHAVMSVITGVPPIPAGRVHTVNLYDLAAPPLVLAGHRRLDCPACGQPPPEGVRERG